MAEVTISIGGFNYQVACRDGEEAHLEKLGSRVAAKAAEARQAVGNISEVRQLLLAALLIADEVEEPQPSPLNGQADYDTVFARLADRLESVADGVEKLASTS